MVWIVHIVGSHLRKLERAFDRPMGSRPVLAFVWFGYISTAILAVIQLLWHPKYVYVDKFIDYASGLVLFGWVTVVLLGCRGFWVSRQLARHEIQHCALRVERSAAERVAWRTQSVLCQAPLTFVSMLGGILVWTQLGWDLQFPDESLYLIGVMFSLTITSRFSLILAGIGPPEKRELFRKVAPKRCGNAGCCGGWERRRFSTWSSGEEAWDDKVQELGTRGVTLRALLDFYWKLGTPDLMKHFDGERHTTADVVRQAIIPMTRDTSHGSCALATLLMNGQSVVPDKLVTHSWNNLFTNLLAAIVADALDAPVYEHVVARLLDPNERRTLIFELFLRSRLDLTYWVCAVSVNQHTVTCDKLPPECAVDTTGTPFQVCSCSTPKYMSNTEPTRADNRSIPCEVNKFDDMMAWLASVNPNFGQCIAADTQLNLFHRAWCVAEMHCAYCYDMVQSLRVFSGATLAANSAWLRTLRVEAMEATNAEDKQMILSKITDLVTFNRQIQRLLFSDDGLLSAWRGDFELGDALQVLVKRAQRRAMESDSSSSEESICGERVVRC
eukprot:TRINITY_DN48345_c0_g1_i2.p1 TRINITY_DN48345_c0_g1~~TRINITY_DN48345_c0_g1_i2.p1  ORF type:complete len:565 (+),score=53.06 TRINITY_DN48345_c0_g1_i2:29-1696(+)